MKRILLYISVLFISAQAFCQSEVVDTLFESTGAIDTTVFRTFKHSVAYLSFDVGTLADNDTVDIGYSTDKIELISVTNIFPLKLTKATYKKTTNGVNGVATLYRFGVEGENWSAKYAAFRVKCAGACSPSIRYNP